MHEIRIRISSPLHNAVTFAAANRSIPMASLVSLALYEYLRERGELTPTQARAVEPAAATNPDFAVWFDEDDEPLNVGS
jgi:hypothetical protein